ncbi:MAG: metallopeptidase family protein [Methylacidiphilales bacterium]|nr:metallopeptidase family protein [Candidatus Methylacidiphilales bacterium]
MTPARWEMLKARAQNVLEQTLAELPPEVLAEAQKVPVLFEKRCPDDPEILGTYGHFEPGEISPANGPIVLYLAAIDDFCAEEGEDFATEVRLTFLHELGHHFGWDEDDLEARGLG